MRRSIVSLLASIFLASISSCWAAAVNGNALVSRGSIRFEQDIRSGSNESYVGRGLNWSLAIDNTGALFTLVDRDRQRSGRVRMRVLGSKPSAPEPSDPLDGKTNYFLGRGPWRTGVPAFGGVTQRRLLSGVDLAFHGTEGRLEYDFIVAPGADPRAIRFELTGGEPPRLSPSGDLLVKTGAGEVTWKRPSLYQNFEGRRTSVAGGFHIDRRTVSFEVGPYDKNQTLVIDPILSYATYLGGTANEMARGVAVDQAGNIYVTGFTTSDDLPVAENAVQPAFAGQTTAFFTGDAYVAKFTATGALAYLTYVGGSADDEGMSIAVDSAGNAYITGSTDSNDFPVTASAYQKTFAGTGNGTSGRIRGGDAFVAKLNPDGSQLIYSTYLGGSLEDTGTSIAVDSTGAAYITGSTLSENFPVTAGVVQAKNHGGGGQPILPSYGVPTYTPGDAFVSKLDPTGSQLIFSTYLGGSLDDAPFAIALDSSGNIYIGGYTISTDFPTTPGAYQGKLGGLEGQSIFFNFGDGFIAKLNSTATALIYSTYFGGVGDDNVMGLAVDASGNVYITGSTSSNNLPVNAGAIQPAFAGYFVLPFLVEQLFGDAYVAKLNPTGSGVVYCTYLGGSQNDMGLGIAVDSNGDAFVAGWTDSSDFPFTANAAQKRWAGDGGQQPYIQFGDGFVSEIDPTGTTLLYSTFYGGSADDMILGLAMDGSGSVYVAGNTLSANLPVTMNAFQHAYGGAANVPVFLTGDAFIAKYAGFSASTVPQLNAVANAANALDGPVSPGMIFIGYGVNLGPSTLTYGTVTGGKLDTSIAGITVSFGGTPAPLIYASAGQLAGFVPYEAQGAASSQVTVANADTGQTSTALSLHVQAASPGIFSTNLTGHGQGAILNADGSPNSAQNPAAQGSVIVIYATGEGQTKPSGIDGLIAGAEPPKPVLPVSVTIGGLPATIEYAGGAPDLAAGTLQVNARLSAKVSSGNQPVVLTIGTFQSQPNLTVAVK